MVDTALFLFLLFGGIPLLFSFGEGVQNIIKNFLVHRQKIARINAIKELKSLPEVPEELIEAWKEIEEL